MVNEFRDGILTLNTRQFGTVIELIVQLLRDYEDSGELEFDLYDADKDERIEVKLSRVYKKQRLELNLQNLYEIIINSSNRNRLLKQSQVENLPADVKFDCNIQQIKIDCFDKLYYLLLFYDVIEIFKIDRNDIKNDKNIGYSDKQHRGNEGEGQFHITQKNYPYHKKTYFLEQVTYNSIKNMLQKKAGQ